MASTRLDTYQVDLGVPPWVFRAWAALRLTGAVALSGSLAYARWWAASGSSVLSMNLLLQSA